MNRRHILIIVSIGLLLGSYYAINAYKWGGVTSHEEIGYNFARYNSIKVNPERMTYVGNLEQLVGHVIEYADVDHEKFGPGTQFRTVQDTLGYGILLGLLWKITGSFRYREILLLQLFMYLLMLLLIYKIVLMLFIDENLAFLSCLCLLSFLPLLAQNNYLVRPDIWSYYGTVILVYGIVKQIKESKFSFLTTLVSGLFFALCMHIRSTSIVALLLVLFVIAIFGLCSAYKEISFKIIGVFIATNFLFFWIPFVSYNKFAYNRWFVSASGMWLLEGIGSFPNPWGYELNDGWYGKYMKDNYGLKTGTPECEDKGRELYWRAVKENPGFILKSLFRQLPNVLFPYLPWAGEVVTPARFINPELTGNWKAKFKLFLKEPSLAFILNAFFDRWFKYVFMLFTYLGMVCMIIDRRWFEFFLLGAVIISGYHFIFSHIEPRYIIPFYWPCSIFVAYSSARILKKPEGKSLGIR